MTFTSQYKVAKCQCVSSANLRYGEVLSTPMNQHVLFSWKEHASGFWGHLDNIFPPTGFQPIESKYCNSLQSFYKLWLFLWTLFSWPLKSILPFGRFGLFQSLHLTIYLHKPLQVLLSLGLLPKLPTVHCGNCQMHKALINLSILWHYLGFFSNLFC